VAQQTDSEQPEDRWQIPDAMDDTLACISKSVDSPERPAQAFCDSIAPESERTTSEGSEEQVPRVESAVDEEEVLRDHRRPSAKIHPMRAEMSHLSQDNSAVHRDGDPENVPGPEGKYGKMRIWLHLSLKMLASPVEIHAMRAVIHQGEISCHVSFPLGFDVRAQEKGRERKKEAESSGREGAGISGTDREGFQESCSERLTRQLRDGQTFKGRFVCTVRSSKWTKKFCFRAARRQQYADLLCSTICGTIPWSRLRQVCSVDLHIIFTITDL